MFDWIEPVLGPFLEEHGALIALVSIPAGLIGLNLKAVFRFVINLHLPAAPEADIGPPVSPPPIPAIEEPSNVALIQARNVLEREGFLQKDQDYPYLRQARQLEENNIVSLMNSVSGPRPAARVAIVREYENALPLAA